MHASACGVILNRAITGHVDPETIKIYGGYLDSGGLQLQPSIAAFVRTSIYCELPRLLAKSCEIYPHGANIGQNRQFSELSKRLFDHGVFLGMSRGSVRCHSIRALPTQPFF
jgi:hypothetical protein